MKLNNDEDKSVIKIFVITRIVCIKCILAPPTSLFASDMDEITYFPEIVMEMFIIMIIKYINVIIMYVHIYINNYKLSLRHR